MSSFLYWTSTFASAFVGIFGLRMEETPHYQVLVEDGQFEVRAYAAYNLASVEMDGESDDAAGRAFSALAGYIFGNNVAGQKIKMTAPVVTPSESVKIKMTAPVVQSQDQKRMSFVMPSKYKFEELPQPKDPRIQLSRQEAETLAVIRFSGRYTRERLEAKQEELLTWIRSRSDLKISGEPRWAGYDAPFVLPFVRRNEVHVPVRLEVSN